LPQLAKGGAASGSAATSSQTPKATPAAKVQPKKKFKATKRAEKNKTEMLMGMETVTKDGQNICWSYNLEGGCQAQLVGGSKPAKCAKGLHVCAFCHKPNHSQMVCNLKKKG
jgi:hypothetical protein